IDAAPAGRGAVLAVSGGLTRTSALYPRSRARNRRFRPPERGVPYGSPAGAGLRMSETPEFSIDRLVEPGGAALLMPRGELDVLAAPVFRARVLDLMPERLPLIVDLHGLEFMDSSGLAALLELRARARQVGWEVTIRGAHGRVRELLERTGTLPLAPPTPA